MTVEEQLAQRLRSSFSPSWMELDNESHQHSVPADSETHFRLVMVSDAFRDLRPVARHQRVYAAVQDLLDGPIHALAMHLFDEGEWAGRDAPAPQSPDCLGGSKADSRKTS